MLYFVIPLLSMCPILRLLPRMRDSQHINGASRVQIINDLKGEAVKHIALRISIPLDSQSFTELKRPPRARRFFPNDASSGRRSLRSKTAGSPVHGCR